MNVGIQHALQGDAAYVLLANNDTVLAPDALDMLMEAVRAADAGIATPVIYYAGEPLRVWRSGGWRRWPTLEIRVCDHGALLAGEPFAVDFVTGCGMLVRRAYMWHKVSTSLGGSDSPGERYHTARSSIQFFRKHIRGWAWLLVGPYRTASALRTLLRLLIHRRHAAAWAHLRGLWEGARV